MRRLLLASLLWCCGSRFVFVGELCLFLREEPGPAPPRCSRCSSSSDPRPLRRMSRVSRRPVSATYRLPAPTSPSLRRLETLISLLRSVSLLELLLVLLSRVMVGAMGSVLGSEGRVRRLLQCTDDYLGVLTRRERFRDACRLVDRTLASLSGNSLLARHVQSATLLRLKSRRRQLQSKCLLQAKLTVGFGEDENAESDGFETDSLSSEAYSGFAFPKSEAENYFPRELIAAPPSTRHTTDPRTREITSLSARRRPFLPR